MTEQLTEGKPESGGAAPAGGPVRVSWAPVPMVNLLPIEILEGRRFRRTQVVLGAAVLSSVLVACAGTFWAQTGVDNANQQLLVSQSRTAVLTAQQARYSAVPTVISQLDAARQARALAMGHEVLWYHYLNDVDAARPDNVYLSSLNLALNSATGSAGGSPAATPATGDPLAATGVGVISANGTAGEYRQVSSWLEALNKVPGFASSSLASASKTQDKVTFGSSAVLTAAAESGRYTKKAG